MPSAVMVWTPTHTRTFLTHACGDRLLPLYHLIAHTGLRRGEACGLHWADVDLDAATLTVRWQLTQLGWATSLTEPKTRASQDTIALDAGTVAVLRAWQRRQQHERDLRHGPSFGDAFVFTHPDGAPHHPAEVTNRFRQLAASAGLPPIRLHDLRHGAATLALAAGVDMRVVQHMLRHSSVVVTSDTYTSVLPEVAHAAAEAVATLLSAPATPAITPT